MKFIPDSVSSYFSSTNTLLYSYLLSLPLLLGYEILLFIAQPTSEMMVRISVDVWIKQLITYLGVDAMGFTLLLVATFGIFILFRDRQQFAQLKLKRFVFLLIEAACYAIILGLLVSAVTNSLTMLNPTSTGSIVELSFIQKLALSLGAGLYEELFFRVILVSASVYILNLSFKNRRVSQVAAILLAAVIFSLAHFTGSLGEPFTIQAFLFRGLFGVALNIIFIARGFGMAAWTHAIYDVIVLLF